jgi:hypothetical protein
MLVRIFFTALQFRLVICLEPQFINLDSYELDFHESVHRDTVMNSTNEMQLYRLIYCS